MNLQEIGYLVLCLSPFMSLGVKWAVGHSIGIYLLAQLSSGIALGGRASLIRTTVANAAVNGLQVWGLLLYLAGYRWGPGQLARTVSTRLAAGVLVGWGIVVSLFMYSIYQTEVIQWSRESGVRALVIWDHVELATWILKGVLLVIAGAVIGLIIKPRWGEPSAGTPSGARRGAGHLRCFSAMYVGSFAGSGIAGAELGERLFPARGPLAAYLIAASLVVLFTVLFGLVVRKLHAETMRGR